MINFVKSRGAFGIYYPRNPPGRDMGDFAGPQAVNDLHGTLVRMNNSLSERAVISVLNLFTFLKTFLSSLIATQFFHFMILYHTPKTFSLYMPMFLSFSAPFS